MAREHGPFMRSRWPVLLPLLNALALGRLLGGAFGAPRVFSKSLHAVFVLAIVAIAREAAFLALGASLASRLAAEQGLRALRPARVFFFAASGVADVVFSGAATVLLGTTPISAKMAICVSVFKLTP